METLAERIARDGPVSELDAIGWAIRLAKRLEALHVLGVSHGSVSPACVIAAGQDRNARAYLADVQHTTTSPSYHSPERILGGDISAADDVWALSATLYALLTGQGPFSSSNEAEIRQKILAASPPPLAVYDVGDDDLQHILDRAFARDLGQRTAGIAAFRHALEEWHPDRGVANLPPLDDEDTTDDDDGARTMLVRDAAAQLAQAGIGPAAPQTPGQPGAGAPSVPRVNVDDDEEDNARTMMRQMPKDGLAAILARATAAQPAPGVAAAAAAPVVVRGPPRPGPPRPAPFPRPAPPRPAGPVGQAGSPPRPAPAAAEGPRVAVPQPAPAAPPPGAPLPQLHEEDTSDDNILTVMRTSEQMLQEEATRDAPRAVPMVEDASSKQAPPAPAADPPYKDGPAPQATVALPAYFEPAAPSFNAAGQGPAEGFLAGAQGTQKLPPLDSLLGPAAAVAPPQGTQKLPVDSLVVPGQAGGPAPAPAQAGAAPQAFPAPAPLAGAPAQPAGDPRTSGVVPQPVLGAAPAPNAMVAAPAAMSTKGLFAAALIALVIAAGLTFAFLKLKGL